MFASSQFAGNVPIIILMYAVRAQRENLFFMMFAVRTTGPLFQCKLANTIKNNTKVKKQSNLSNDDSEHVLVLNHVLLMKTSQNN